MRLNRNHRKNRHSTNKLAASVASFALERIEDRVLLSTTLAAWQFDTLPGTTSTSTIETSPAPTSGAGTAYTVGMQSGTANGYLYPAAGADATADASTFLAATGNADSGGNGGSEGGSNGFVWRVESGQDSAAAIGSQGVQFNVATTGYSGISVQFDLDASSTKAEAQFAVEYTTDVQDANPVWNNVTNLLAFGPNDTANTQGTVPSIGTSPTDSVYIQNNTSNSNIISGDYATITGPIVGGSNTSWLNDLVVDLSSISAVSNSGNFAFRVVNAATGTADTNIVGAASGTFKNWRFNDIVINASGNNVLSKPAIVSNPANQMVTAGQPVSFTASASGNPTPTVQWFAGAPGSGTAIIGNPTATTTTLTFTTSSNASDNGTTYYAEFTNSQGVTDTTAAELTDFVPATAPAITMQPASQSAAAGSSVTLIAAASGTPTPAVQWQISTNGGSNWSPIAGQTSAILTLSATQGISGDEYEAVFTNTGGSATTDASTVTVGGTPIVEWDFATGEAASPGGFSGAGSANSPLPTSEINPGNSTSILGLVNSYDGLPSFPEADIIPLASSVDPSVEDYLWRVRGGGGQGPTGTPGNPDGWSQNAPEATQGVEFNINTTGFSNVTWNFDWTQGSIADMQAQYYDGSQWVNIGVPVQATGSDYYGVSAPTTTSSADALTADSSTTINVASSKGFYFDEPITVGGIGAIVTGVATGDLTLLPTASGSVASQATVVASPDPTGVSINLQGIAFADNNPDLQVRLVSVYDPALPNIIDGNPAVSQTSHGQYAGGFGLANDIQVIDMDDFVSSGGSSFSADGQNFTLTLGNQTTSLIQYSSDPMTMAANIQAALAALPDVGAGNVSVASTIATNTYTPPGPITAYNGFSVIFGAGPLKDQPEPTMTISDPNDNVSTWQNATPSTITTTVTAPYTVTAQTPLTLSVASTANFTAGNPILLGNITCLITSVGSGSLTVTPETSGSVLNSTTVQQLGATGFVDGGGSWELGNITFSGDVMSGTPGITSNPASESAAAGFAASFTASAYSESLPTVQWQVSTDGGSSWANVSGGTVTPTNGIYTSQSSNSAYTSTYTFTTDANLDQNGYEYRAVFANSSGPTDSGSATLTVVSPLTPYVLIQPANASVQEGESTFFTTLGTGLPAPAVQWQISTDGGSSWTDVTDSGTVNGSITDTLTLTTASNTSQNGDLFRAVFSSDAGVTDSNAVTLTVLPTESILTDWDFNASYPSVSATGTADPYVTNPAPVPTGTDNSLDVGGVATPVGMNLPYNPNDPATGTGAPGAVDAEDIVNSGPAVIDSTFTENTWRIRAGINSTTGGAPANGWSNFVPQYTQGAEFSVPTTGYGGVYVTLDWFTTHSGEQDAQEQYTLDGGSTWINLGSQLQLYAPGNDDFYGDSDLGGVVPVVFDLTGIAGAANNPNFGIRLVNSYNLVLSNQQTIQLNDASNFTLTLNGQTTGAIDYSPVQSTMVANIQSAIGALSNVGPNNVSVSYNSNNGGYVVQFMGTLGTSIQPVMTINTISGQDTVTQQDQYANAQLSQNGDPFSVVPYNGSKGNWRFDNIVFHGSALPVSVTWTGLGDGINWSNPGNWSDDAVPNSTDSVIIPAGAKPYIGTGSFAVEALILQGNATIDLGSGTLMIDYGTGPSPIATIQSLLVSGRDGGKWDGTGIDSSAAAADPTAFTIGYADGDNPVDAANTGVPAGEIEIKYTVAGDVNLSGTVDLSDLVIVASDFGESGADWASGDVNYDGNVDLSDLVIVASNFGDSVPQQTPASANLAAPSAASSPVSVPAAPSSTASDQSVAVISDAALPTPATPTDPIACASAPKAKPAAPQAKQIASSSPTVSSGGGDSFSESANRPDVFSSLQFAGDPSGGLSDDVLLGTWSAASQSERLLSEL
jgi:Immunoglobulin I-set domain